MNFRYQAEKFSDARRALMLPHTRGEAESIAEAFRECMHGLHRFDRSTLDEGARDHLRQLEDLMNGPRDFTVDQKLDISRHIDELASWFNMRFWQGD